MRSTVADVGHLADWICMARSPRSWPAEKPRPAPVSTRTRTAGSSWMRSRATRSSAYVVGEAVELVGPVEGEAGNAGGDFNWMFAKFIQAFQREDAEGGRKRPDSNWHCSVLCVARFELNVVPALDDPEAVGDEGRIGVGGVGRRLPPVPW